MGGEALQELGLEPVIGGAGHRRARHGAGIEGGQEGRVIVPEECKGRRFEQSLPAHDTEVYVAAEGGVEIARFDMEAADCDTHQCPLGSCWIGLSRKRSAATAAAPRAQNSAETCSNSISVWRDRRGMMPASMDCLINRGSTPSSEAF